MTPLARLRLAGVRSGQPDSADDAGGGDEVVPESGAKPVPLDEAPAAAAATAADHQRPRSGGIATQAARTAHRTAHRARRTWFALLFFPIFLAYLVVDFIRDVRDLAARLRRRELERTPPFRRSPGMPAPEQRSMREITAVVEAFPFDPLPLPTQLAFFRDNGPDAIGALLSPNPQISTFPHMYPAPFRQRLFTGVDGHQLAGMQAMHEHRGPAVVICHGLLMTKNFDVIIQLARRAFERWGFHVVTLDLRGWGQSAWTTNAPASAGYFEGRDVVEICRELHRSDLVTSVAAIGYSLGGASVLNAAHVSSTCDDRPLDGGAVAVSAPTDVAEALDHISRRPHWRDPFFGLWHLFRAAIKGNVRRRGLRRDLRTWKEMVEEMSAPYYGVSMDEFCSRASAASFAAGIEQPVLALHAADDFLVPVHHAYRLRDAAADNPWVHVMVRDSGNHCSFTAVDARWFHSTVRCWLEYWAAPGDEPA